MERKDALAIISNGHGIYSVQTAEDVCTALGVTFAEGRMLDGPRTEPV